MRKRNLWKAAGIMAAGVLTVNMACGGTSSVYAGETKIAASADRETQKEKSEKTESSSSKEENRNQNKNKNRARNQQLGQPVKRENPNRENTKVSKNEKEEKRSTELEDRKMNETTSEKPETAPKATSSAWADAVQNAMRAIDKE